jgi:hypothetical protein
MRTATALLSARLAESFLSDLGDLSPRAKVRRIRPSLSPSRQTIVPHRPSRRHAAALRKRCLPAEE